MLVVRSSRQELVLSVRGLLELLLTPFPSKPKVKPNLNPTVSNKPPNVENATATLEKKRSKSRPLLPAVKKIPRADAKKSALLSTNKKTGLQIIECFLNTKGNSEIAKLIHSRCNAVDLHLDKNFETTKV